MTTPRPLRRGLTLGKFMPPHRGHQFLIDFARGYVDELVVLVCSLPDDPIPGALRYDWMRRLYPDCRVVHVTDDLPQAPEDDPGFYAVWKALVEREAPRGLDVFISSETYGEAFADYLGIGHLEVDVGREQVPVSARDILRNPFAAWDSIPRLVRPWFVKRICIFGPESTGKSRLTEKLAARFETNFATEFARVYLDAKGGGCTLADIDVIARGQPALEDAAAFNANKLLFCDTDVLLTSLWSRMLFGTCAPWIDALAARRTCDLTLLTDIDVPWVDDGQRYFPDTGSRQRFFALCEAAQVAAGRPYVRLSGDWRARDETAVRAIDKAFGH